MEAKGIFGLMLLVATSVCYERCNPDLHECEDPCEPGYTCIDGICMDEEVAKEHGETSMETCKRNEYCSEKGFCVKKSVVKLTSPIKKCDKGKCAVDEYCDVTDVCQKKKNFNEYCCENEQCKTGICSTSEFEYRDHEHHSHENQDTREFGICRACVEDKQCQDTYFCRNYKEDDSTLTPCLPKKLYHHGKPEKLHGRCPTYEPDGGMELVPCAAAESEKHECEHVYGDYYDPTVYFPKCAKKLGTGEPCSEGRLSMCDSGVCELGKGGYFCA